jgi:hypothetical protein
MNQKIMGIIAGIIIAIAIIGAAGFVYAQQITNKSNDVVTKATGFIDSDNDGVCDNAQSGSCSYRGQAGGFVDADNDGVCDNAANCPMHNSNGGCHGSEGCPMRNKAGGCHALTTPSE